MAIISNAVTIADAGAFSASLGSMTLIKTLTASSSANLSFVHGASSVVLDGTYPIYKFVFTSIHPQTDQVKFSFNVSIDSGSNYNVAKTTTFIDAYHNEGGSSAGAIYHAPADLAQGTGFQNLTEGANLGNDNDQSLSGELFLFSPSSTTFVKHFIATTNFYSQNEYSINDYIGGYANTTSAVNAIQFKMSSGNIDAGTIKLYGIKDS
jgi:hypothetical protein